MAKALTVELFLGVLAVAALDGCATREKAAPEPAPAASAASPPVTPGTPAAPGAIATTTAAPALDESGGSPLAAPATPVGRAVVDAGVEVKRKDGPPSVPARKAPAAQAACGAGGCSADMKKGTK